MACFLNASKRNSSKTISAVIGVSELHEVKVKKNGKEIYLRKILLHAARAGKSVNKRQADRLMLARALFLNFVTMQQTVEMNNIAWNLRHLTSVEQIHWLSAMGNVYSVTKSWRNCKMLIIRVCSMFLWKVSAAHCRISVNYTEAITLIKD